MVCPHPRLTLTLMPLHTATAPESLGGSKTDGQQGSSCTFTYVGWCVWHCPRAPLLSQLQLQLQPQPLRRERAG